MGKERDKDEKLDGEADEVSGVVVIAGGGVRIEIMPSFDGATLKRVLATLGAGA